MIIVIHIIIIITHLVKGDHIYAAAEADVLGVEAVDPTALQALLGEGIVGCEGGREDGRNNKGEDVEAVENTLGNGALKEEEE